MSVAEQSVRDRIMLATVTCIERDGMDAVTVRGIAKEAGVNSAAINYYFGTKQKLIEATLQHVLRQEFIGSLAELDEAVEAERGDLRAGLANFLTEFFGNMLRWPRVTEAHLHDALMRQDYDGTTIREANAFFEQFLARIRPVLAKGSEADLKLSVIQMWSAMLLLSLMPRLFERFCEVAPSDAEWQEKYVRRLLGHFLGGPEALHDPAGSS